tara:strand:- start:267 stop:419 length:153 start_codon:yes stop_codon:yes gene_type:complete
MEFRFLKLGGVGVDVARADGVVGVVTITGAGVVVVEVVATLDGSVVVVVT